MDVEELPRLLPILQQCSELRSFCLCVYPSDRLYSRRWDNLPGISFVELIQSIASLKLEEVIFSAGMSWWQGPELGAIRDWDGVDQLLSSPEYISWSCLFTIQEKAWPHTVDGRWFQRALPRRHAIQDAPRVRSRRALPPLANQDDACERVQPGLGIHVTNDDTGSLHMKVSPKIAGMRTAMRPSDFATPELVVSRCNQTGAESGKGYIEL